MRRRALPGHAHPHIACLHIRRGEASDQALPASLAHRPLEAWEALAGCIPARSSRPPEATHHHHRCSRRLCSTTLSQGNGRVGDIHSFSGIDRIHSFIPHSLSLARVQRHLTPYCLIPAVCNTQPSPETPTTTSVSNTANTRLPSWLRHRSLGSRPRAIQSIATRPHSRTSRDRTWSCCCPGA